MVPKPHSFSLDAALPGTKNGNASHHPKEARNPRSALRTGARTAPNRSASGLAPTQQARRRRRPRGERRRTTTHETMHEPGAAGLGRPSGHCRWDFCGSGAGLGVMKIDLAEDEQHRRPTGQPTRDSGFLVP